jgi:uncharacterized membrane protein YjfL (UPF0719 family)
MSGDEMFAAIVSAIVAASAWWGWYYSLAAIPRWPLPSGTRWALGLTPPLCLAGVFVVLKTIASFDVRESPLYLGFYMLFGAGWLGLFRVGLGWLGFSWRDDAVERGNPAAGIATVGGLIGLTACYAGANVGDGPGWWCVLVAGGLGTAAWYAVLAAFQRVTDAAESITVERDVAAALRHAGVAIAVGLLCGRGAAGDWTSAEQTFNEFASAWPALVIAGIAAAVEFVFRPDASRRYRPPAWAGVSALLAVVYILFAVAALLALPPVPQNPAYDQPPASHAP